MNSNENCCEDGNGHMTKWLRMNCLFSNQIYHPSGFLGTKDLKRQYKVDQLQDSQRYAKLIRNRLREVLEEYEGSRKNLGLLLIGSWDQIKSELLVYLAQGINT
ncbi:hypothetical protein ACJX0J_022079 [Zea mays]